jgi:hypothetical protein
LLEAALLRWLEERALEVAPFLADGCWEPRRDVFEPPREAFEPRREAFEPPREAFEPPREAFELPREAFELVRLDPARPEALEPLWPDPPDVRPRLVPLDWVRADARLAVPR